MVDDRDDRGGQRPMPDVVDYLPTGLRAGNTPLVLPGERGLMPMHLFCEDASECIAAPVCVRRITIPLAT